MIRLALPWWRDRTPRERVLLTVMAVLLVGAGLWFGLLRPLANARAEAAARYEAAATALADVQRMGTALRAAEARAGAARSLPIVELVSARAADAGLTVESLTADGAGQARLVIAAVRPQAFLAWLADLERRDGLVVESLTISRNDDATIAVQLVLRTPA